MTHPPASALHSAPRSLALVAVLAAMLMKGLVS